jgi:hypothetical protein
VAVVALEGLLQELVELGVVVNHGPVQLLELLTQVAVAVLG